MCPARYSWICVWAFYWNHMNSQGSLKSPCGSYGCHHCFVCPKNKYISTERVFLKQQIAKNVDRLNDRLSHTKLLNLYMYFWDFYFQTWTKFALFFNFSLISNSPLLDHSRHLPAPAHRYKHKLKCSIIHKTEIPHHDLHLKHIKGRNIYFVTG